MMLRVSILTAVLSAFGLPLARGAGQAERDVGGDLRRLDIVYQQPAARSVDHLPVGNGQVGLLVAPLGSQTLGGYVMKSDVWDYRHAHPAPLAGKGPVPRDQQLRRRVAAQERSLRSGTHLPRLHERQRGQRGLGL